VRDGDGRGAGALVAGLVAGGVGERAHAARPASGALGAEEAGRVGRPDVEPLDVAGRAPVAAAGRVVGLVARDRPEREPVRARSAVLSIRITSVFFASAVPALSVAKYVTVVVPSAVTFTDVCAPEAVASAVCASVSW
jgi:hypothetical protein